MYGGTYDTPTLRSDTAGQRYTRRHHLGAWSKQSPNMAYQSHNLADYGFAEAASAQCSRSPAQSKVVSRCRLAGNSVALHALREGILRSTGSEVLHHSKRCKGLYRCDQILTVTSSLLPCAHSPEPLAGSLKTKFPTQTSMSHDMPLCLLYNCNKT